MATKKNRAPTTFVRQGGPRIVAGATQESNVINITTAPPKPIENPPFVITYQTVKSRGKPFSLDLRYLAPLKNIGAALRDGILAHLGPRPSRNTAKSYSNRLKDGFIKFLIQKELLDIGVADVGAQIMVEFEEWLNHQKFRGFPLSETTRAMRYNYVRTIFSELSRNPAWSKLVSEHTRFKTNVWPSRTAKVKKRKVLDDDLMTRIRVACIEEIEEFYTKRADYERIRDYYDILFNSKKGDGNEAVCSKLNYEYLVYSISQIIEENPGLKAKQLPKIFAKELKKKKIEFLHVRELVFPTPRRLVPFVILLALALAYNSSTTLDIRLNDISYTHNMTSFLVHGDGPSSDASNGSNHEIFFNAYKARAGKRQPVYIPVDDAFDNPHFIISFIKNWTSGLRKPAYSGVAERLFIYASGHTRFGVTSLSGQDTSEQTSSWRSALIEFRRNHGLENFSLENIRPTALDVAFDALDGDIRLVGAQANHSFIETTDRSYESDAEKQRQYERLGAVHNRRDRWRKTHGKIDVRDRPAESDLDCATPGWSCADPSDSPFTAKGHLCGAYGMCPACPLGGVDLNSPLSCAYTIALLESIDNAQQSLEPATWINRWGPVKRRILKKWLPSFSRQAMTKAREVSIPPLPRPE